MKIEPEINPPWVYESHEDDKPRFDIDQIEYWLGSDNTLEEAIEIITAIANEEYSVKNLIKDLDLMFPED
jgi:hypothetical protein